MLRSVRRGAALVAVPALALAALAATPGTASAAGTDLNPSNAAANWLEMQAPDYGPFGIGNTIDQAIALAVIGGHESTVQSIGAGVADNLESYTNYAYCDDFTDPYEQPPCDTTPLIEGVSAGAVGKALVGLQVAGVDATDVVTQLEGLLPDTGDLAGRAVSPQTSDGVPTYSGYTNVIGQSFAVRGLQSASSGEAATAAAYLIGLQCADGSFKEDLPDESGAQTCAATPSYSSTSVDSTALAVLALDAVGTDAADIAVTKASSWLASVQQSSGGFASNGSSDAPNANATGLATQALGLTSASAPAAKGAIWVRQHQVHYQDACAPFAASASGAIAYDDADRTAGATDGITASTYGTWLRATAQAAPALLWAPKGDGANALFTAEYVKAGGAKPVGVTGADPGEQLCALAGNRKVVGWADANGEASLKVAIPTRTATTKVAVYDVETKLDTATIRALGAKKLPIALKAKIKKGKVQRVTVRGLAVGESVKVRLLGKTKRGQANKRGVFTTAVKVTGKPRKVKVAVVGEFGTRTGSKTFKVVR